MCTEARRPHLLHNQGEILIKKVGTAVKTEGGKESRNI